MNPPGPKPEVKHVTLDKNGKRTVNPVEQYIHERDEQIKENKRDRDLEVSIYRLTEWLVKSNYTKNFTWMGVPILQYPSDLMVMQELIWKIQPDYIIETGIAFGGSTLFYAHMLRMVGKGKVVAIDIDIRPHASGVCKREENIIFISDDSSCPRCHAKVVHEIGYLKHGMVVLDSCHTHDHVLAELRLYSPLVSVGSYIVVFDTAIEFFSHLDKNQDRPWGKGNNPATAVKAFLEETDDFIVDKDIDQRALITSAPGGWLRRIK